MRRIYPLLLLLPLMACENGQSIDGKAFFESIKQAGNAATHDSLLDSAKAAENKGDFHESAEYYQQALAMDPSNRDLKMALADSYRRGGDPDRAITIYDALLKDDANFLSAKEGKGLALMAKGDYQSPTALFDQVLKADRTRWKTLNALGILFSTRKLYSEAGQYFQEALKYNPNNAGVLNNLALTQALTKDYDPAIKNLTQAVSLTERGSADRKRIDLNLALVDAVADKLDDARDIVSRYSSSSSMEYDMSLYEHVIGDSKLADNYLHMALTEGKTLQDKAKEAQQTSAQIATQINSDGEEEKKWTVVPKQTLPKPVSKSAHAVKSSATHKPAKKPVKKTKPKIVEVKPAKKSPDAVDPLSNIVGKED
jgi:Flp pilus assembly protein TadD